MPTSKGKKFDYKVLQVNDSDLQQRNPETQTTLFEDLLDGYGKKHFGWGGVIQLNPVDIFVVLVKELE